MPEAWGFDTERTFGEWLERASARNINHVALAAQGKVQEATL